MGHNALMKKEIWVKLHVSEEAYKILAAEKARAGTWRDAVLLAFLRSLELEALRASGKVESFVPVNDSLERLRHSQVVLKREFHIPSVAVRLLEEYFTPGKRP